MLVDSGRLFNFGTSLYQTTAVGPTTEEINDASTEQFIGVVPAGWKTANVVPIFKKGHHAKPANYQPVSLTFVVSKALEHIVVSNHVS